MHRFGLIAKICRKYFPVNFPAKLQRLRCRCLIAHGNKGICCRGRRLCRSFCRPIVFRRYGNIRAIYGRDIFCRIYFCQNAAETVFPCVKAFQLCLCRQAGVVYCQIFFHFLPRHTRFRGSQSIHDDIRVLRQKNPLIRRFCHQTVFDRTKRAAVRNRCSQIRLKLRRADAGCRQKSFKQFLIIFRRLQCNMSCSIKICF